MKNKFLIIGLTITILILISVFLLIGLNDNNYEYILSRRISKVMAIVITAIAISLSTVVFQTVSDNRILTPSVMGLDSLYILIQTIIIFIFSSASIFILNKNLNFLITVGIMVLFSGILFKRLLKKEDGNIMHLLLIEIILGTLFQSISLFMQMMIDPNEFMHIQDKMFASFNNVNIDILRISILIISIISIYLFRNSNQLDILSLGRDKAVNLGLDFNSIVNRMLFIVSILISISTALVGPITFLGLLIVNLGREMQDTYEHKYLFIISSLLGILALIGGQLLSERVFNFSAPISIIINFVGGVYFIYLLLKENIG